MSVNSKMTAIADKIRTLLGITGTMGLDSMASNLETAGSLLADGFSEVSGKGGTLPASRTLLNLPDAIRSIPTGVTSGPYTHAVELIWTAPADIADGANVTISHTLGAVPDGFNMVALETQFGDTEYIVSNVVFDRAMLYVETYPFIATFGIGDSLGNSSVGFYLDVDGSVVTSDNISFTLSGITAPFCIPAGKQYRVLVYKR